MSAGLLHGQLLMAGCHVRQARMNCATACDVVQEPERAARMHAELRGHLLACSTQLKGAVLPLRHKERNEAAVVRQMRTILRLMLHKGAQSRPKHNPGAI